jgi:TRAP-type C4-dicarboxylate transport system permease small subunit
MRQTESTDRVVRYCDRVSKVIGYTSLVIGTAFTFLMTLLITVDVLMRYVLNMTTYVATEYSGYMLVGIAFIGLAYTQRAGKHIRITLLTERLPIKVQRRMEIPILIIAVLFISYLAWLTLDPVISSYILNRVSLTEVKTPLWIPYFFVPFGFAMLAIELAIETIKEIRSRTVKLAVDPLGGTI